MRYYIAVAITLLFAACSGNHPQTGVDISAYKQRSIRLANGIGIVSIYLPPEFDTVYSFVNFGEYHCAEIKLHRFVNKKYTDGLISSPDFDYGEMPDSAYQFTIVQTYDKDCEQYIDINPGFMQDFQNSLNALNRNIAPLRKYSMREINGNKFVTCELSTQRYGMNLEELYGITQADGRMVKFIFQCFSKNNDDFIARMKASLNTVQISPDEKGK